MVVFQALALAYAIWLTMRVTLSRVSVPAYVTVVALLTLTTGVGWVVAYVMPDPFAATLVLGVYVLCLRWDRVATTERIAVVGIVWVSIVVHTSHLTLIFQKID